MRVMMPNLRAHVRALTHIAGRKGRNTEFPKALHRSADYIEEQLRRLGYRPRRQQFTADGVKVCNIDCQTKGLSARGEIIVIGAHYDTVSGTPGADDNASGTAALLELARLSRTRSPLRGVRFAFFVNEEPPYFQTELMGSYLYARRLRRMHARVACMICLESVGYYSDKRGTEFMPLKSLLELLGRQRLANIIPDVPVGKGNFVAFVGNSESKRQLDRALQAFGRATNQVPTCRIVLPSSAPFITWSDHWSFWQHDYPAFMITDTAPFRNRRYHRHTDGPSTLNYAVMTNVVSGLDSVLVAMAGSRRHHSNV